MHDITATIQCECGDVAVVECQIISPVAGEVFSVPVQQPGGMITVPLGARSDLKPGEVVVVRVTISRGNSFVARCVVPEEPEEVEPDKLLGFTLSGQKIQEATDSRNPVYRITASLTAEVHSGSASARVQMISPFAGEELAVPVSPAGSASLSLGDHALQPGEQVVAVASLDGGNSIQAVWTAPEETPPEPEPDELLSLNVSGQAAETGMYQLNASLSAKVSSHATARCQIISPFAGQESSVSISSASPGVSVSLGTHALDPGEEVVVVAWMDGGNRLQDSWTVPQRVAVGTPPEQEEAPIPPPIPSEAAPPGSTGDPAEQRDAIQEPRSSGRGKESRPTSREEQKDPGGIKVELELSKGTLRGDGKDSLNAKVVVIPVEPGDRVSVTEVFFELLWEHHILGGHETRSYLDRKYLQMVGQESADVTAPFTKWDGKLLIWAWVTATVTSASGISAERKGSASARIPVAGANPKLTLEADRDTIDLDGSTRVIVTPSLVMFGEPASNFEISSVSFAQKLFARENEQDLKRLVLRSKFHLEDEIVKAYRGSPSRISCSVRLTDTMSEHYPEIRPDSSIDMNLVPSTILFDPADPDSLPDGNGLFRTRLRGKVVSGSKPNRPISGDDIKRDRPEGALDWRFEFTFDQSESGLPEAWHSFNAWPSLPEDVKECTVQDVGSRGELIFLTYDRDHWKPADAPPPVEPPIPTAWSGQAEMRPGPMPSPPPPPKQIIEAPPAIRSSAQPWKPSKIRPSQHPYFDYDHGDAFYDHHQGFLNGQGSTIKATFHADGVRFDPVKFQVWPPCKLFAYVDEGFRSKAEAGGAKPYIFQVGHAYIGLFEEGGTGILAGCFEVNNLPIGTAELRDDASHEFDMRRGWDITRHQYKEALREIRRWKEQCDRKEMWYNVIDIKGGAINLPFTGKGNCASFVDAVFRAALVPPPFAADLPLIDIPFVGDSIGPYGYLLTRPGTLANSIRHDRRTEHHPKKDATEFEDNWPYKHRKKYYRRLLGLAAVVDRFRG